MPVIIGLVPGVIAGTYFIATANPAWLKFWTFVHPAAADPAAGRRLPAADQGRAAGRAARSAAASALLYAVTTISGTAAGAMLTNQGLAKEEFRAAIGFIRLAESSMTAVAYWQVGLYSAESFG